MNRSYLLTAAAVILVGAGAFWAGTAYRGVNGIASGTAQSAWPTGMQEGQKPPDIAQGEVISKSASAFVVKGLDGTMKSVSFASTTQATVTVVSTKSAANIAVGENVFVIGSASEDGTLQAETINIIPVPPTPALSAPESASVSGQPNGR